MRRPRVCPLVFSCLLFRLALFVHSECVCVWCGVLTLLSSVNDLSALCAMLAAMIGWRASRRDATRADTHAHAHTHTRRGGARQRRARRRPAALAVGGRERERGQTPTQHATALPHTDTKHTDTAGRSSSMHTPRMAMGS